MNEGKSKQGLKTVKDVKTPSEDQTQAKASDITTAKQMEENVALLDKDKAEEFRSRWQEIQTSFVDDPHRSVENADDLVANVMDSISEAFADERTYLEGQWNQGMQASTEDLRLAITRYRSFFNRLLSLDIAEKS